MAEKEKLTENQLAGVITLARSLVTMGDAVPQLQDEVNKRERKVAEADGALKAIQNDIAAATSTRETVKSEVATLRGEVSDLTARKAALAADVAQLEAAKTRMKQEIPAELHARYGLA